MGLMKVFGLNIVLIFGVITLSYAAESTAVNHSKEKAATRQAAKKVKVSIEGVSDELEQNIKAYMGDVEQEDLQQWRETQARLRKSIREALESLGYYQAEFKLTPQENKLHLSITPNQPVLIQKIDLQYQGEIGNDIAFTTVREMLPIKEGDVLHHGKYENTKTLLQNLALERGYFDAAWLKHEVIVEQPAQHATINLVYDSGKRYKFGKTTFSTPNQTALPLTEQMLFRFVPYQEGDEYEADKIIKLNKSLLDSRYFNQVKVRADSEFATNGVMPVDVTITAEKPNQIDMGAGYASDIGARLSTAWRRPLFNPNGHSIEMLSELSKVRQSLTMRYGIPWTHPINDILQITTGFKREEIDESAITNNIVFGIERQKKRDSGWQTSASLRWSRESYHKNNGEKGQSDLLLPSYGLSKVRTKGSKTDPERGDKQYYQLEFASPDMLSDVDLLSVRMGWRWLNTFFNRHQLSVRIDGGAIFSSDFDSIPLDMRFYAGGDQSVRGYDYKSLSPKDSDNQVIGASNLVSLSGEYGFKLSSKWRVASFVDSGNAFDSASVPLKVGAGVGVRWISPVGPVRLDVAWPLDNPNNNNAPRLHFFMGPAL